MWVNACVYFKKQVDQISYQASLLGSFASLDTFVHVLKELFMSN